MSQLDLSIVIVSYNTRQLLLDCLSSIYARSDLAVECIIVDNVSKDGSVEAVQEHFPQARVIANSVNTFYSKGNNQGIELAQGRYILVLNPDTRIQGDTLRQLIQQMDARPEIGAATTMMYFPDGALQRNGSRHVTFGFLVLNYTVFGKLFSGWKQKVNDWLWYSDWDRRSQREVGVLPGSCIIARRETWKAIGGYEVRLPMYFSDDYFSLLVKRRGAQTVYLVTDGIIHYEGQSAKQVKAWALRIYFHDLLVYTRLVFGRIAQVILAILVLPTWIALRLRSH